MAVVEECAGVIGVEGIRGIVPRRHQKARSGDAVICLVDIQPMQVDRVALRTWVCEIQLHRLALSVGEQWCRKRNESIGNPAISPNWHRCAIREKRIPLHPRKQLRRLLLGVKRGRKPDRADEHHSAKNVLDAAHGSTMICVSMPPG